jgi:hypothetical protein
MYLTHGHFTDKHSGFTHNMFLCAFAHTDINTNTASHSLHIARCSYLFRHKVSVNTAYNECSMKHTKPAIFKFKSTGIVAVVEWLGRSSFIPEVVDSSPPAVTYFLSTCFDLKPLTMATLM